MKSRNKWRKKKTQKTPRPKIERNDKAIDWFTEKTYKTDKTLQSWPKKRKMNKGKNNKYPGWNRDIVIEIADIKKSTI